MNWMLNKRHFGALTGTSKLNSNRITHWDNRPPPMLPNYPHYDRIQNDPRYKNVTAELPNTESLADCQRRFIHNGITTIAPQVNSGERILVVAQQKLLRGVIKNFNELPFIYRFDEKNSVRAINDSIIIIFSFTE